MASGPNLSAASSPPQTYSETWSVDDRYVVKLMASGEGGLNETFETPVDETLAINMGSQWAAPFENLLQETAGAMAGKTGVVGTIGKVVTGASAAGKAFGMNGKNKSLSAQIWQSSDPMQLTIPFTFIARKSAKEDVYMKCLKLLRMVAPTEVGGILHAPGPTLYDAAAGWLGGGGSGREIVVTIGKYLMLKPCILTDVQVQFDNVIGEEGIPLRAKVNVQIKSWYNCFSVQSLDEMFVLKG